MKRILYHGSKDLISVPLFGFGNTHNDYGQGFYCTENIELAKEWASSDSPIGYANIYRLDLEGLRICDLSTGHHILNWLAVLLENRTFDLSSGVALKAKEYILETFRPEYKDCDVITGYRADDSYFAFAKDFLNNSIPLEKLSEAMRLGKLGEQVVLISEKAFDKICFTGAEMVNNAIYYPRKQERDAAARAEYREAKDKFDFADSTFVMDIIRDGWKNDDARLQ